jgi:hypothetical protein
MEEKNQQSVVSPIENSGIIEAPVATTTNGSSISTTAAAAPEYLEKSSSTLSTEKPDDEKIESKADIIDETEKKKLKREKVGRVLTFIGLQVSLFLAALDK